VPTRSNAFTAALVAVAVESLIRAVAFTTALILFLLLFLFMNQTLI